MSQESDRALKRERLIAILDSHDAPALVLTSQPALGWYLDGARVHVSLGAPPIVAMRVSRDSDEVFVTSNERGRLLAEELPTGLTVHSRAWHAALDPVEGLREESVQRELRDARRRLLPGETARYAALCAETAAALTDALSTVSPDATERELAASVTGRLVAMGAEPLVVLVGGASRLLERHPLPSSAPIGRRAVVTVCARRHGMIANLSRWLRFGAATTEEAGAERRLLDVEAAVLDATIPGARLGGILARAAAAYAEAGFGAEEWTRHHQGGPTGYEGRDPRAVPGADDEVVTGQALTWNPTAPAAKVEDTVLTTEDGLRVLTADPRWPVIVVAGRARPITLER